MRNLLFSVLLIVSVLILPQHLVAQQLTPAEVQTSIENRVPDEPAFVPGQILLKMQDDAPMDNNTMSAMGVDTSYQEISGGVYVYQLPAAAMAQAAVVDSTQAVRDRLATLPEVEFAQLNYIYNIVSEPRLSVPGFTASLPATPVDPRYAEQWHYFNNGSNPGESPGGINLPNAWDQTQGDASVVVAVIDTGILPDHPDANPSNLVAGYDMISGIFTANDGDARDADPTDPGDAIAANECNGQTHPARDDSWHGSHVAGTIGYGRTNDAEGIAGVNWNVAVQPVRALGKCGGATSDIIDAIRWSAGLVVTGLPLNTTPARIINMSLGGAGVCGTNPLLQIAINDATEAGATVVVAAGNSAADAARFTPASCDNVITVASSEGRGHLATRYSNFGNTVEIMAPGGDVTRDDDGNGQPDGVLSMTGRGYEYYNGTSMAAPHVAGVLALWLADNPALSSSMLLSRLQATAMPRSNVECPNPCGAGLVDANNFVDAVSLDLALDPDVKIPNGDQTEAVATATQGGNPVAGLTVDFQIADPTKAKVVDSPPSAVTDANGEARVTIEGVDSRGRTELTASAGAASDTVTVKVPDVTVIGVVLMIALIVLIEYRRSRQVVSDKRMS